MEVKRTIRALAARSWNEVASGQMVRRLIVSVLSALICGPLVISADFRKMEWEFLKKIEAQTLAAQGSYYRVLLDGETYNHSQRSLADLRLIDDRGQEVAYTIFVQRDSVKEEEYSPRIFNNSVLRNAYSVVALDLGRSVSNNKLTLLTSSHNFRRRVEIAGSNNARQWFVLKDDAFIFDFSGEQKIQLTTVNYPENQYRFLQVKVWNHREPPLALDGAKLFFFNTTTAQRVVRPSQLLSHEQDKKLKRTIWILDLRYRHLPVDFLGIETSERNFFRAVELHGSNDFDHWERQENGELYCFRTEKYSVEKKTLRFPEMRFRYLKLVVYNHDDPPLELGGFEVQGVDQELIFQAQSGREYFLYFGNPLAGSPQYDIERMKSYLSIEALPTGRLGVEQMNSLYRPIKPKRPWTETQPLLFWGSLVLMVLGLGTYIVRLIGRVKVD